MIEINKTKNLLLILIVIFFVFFIYRALFCEKNVHIWDEKQIEKGLQSYGLSWLIISSEKQAKRIEEVDNIVLPKNDYTKNYLLISDGRKIISLKYKKISKYQWQYDVPMGVEVFDDNLTNYCMYVYKIPKIVLKQNGD